MILRWIEDETAETCDPMWWAESKIHDEGTPFVYRIYEVEDSRFRHRVYTISGTDAELLDDDQRSPARFYLSLDYAQEHCEEIERDWLKDHPR